MSDRKNNNEFVLASDDAASIRARMDALSTQINDEGLFLGDRLRWRLEQERGGYGEKRDYDDILSNSLKVDKLLEEYFALEQQLKTLEGSAADDK